MTERDVIAMMEKLSNWERWGADDQLGTINFITLARGGTLTPGAARREPRAARRSA